MKNLSSANVFLYFFLLLICTIVEAVEMVTVEKIDINTASLEELQKIKWVGPVIAQRIIEARPFYSVDELIKVNGIGPKILQDIKKQGLVWVDPNLKPPQTNKEIKSSDERGMAAVTQSLEQQHLFKELPNSISVLFIALSLAIFSGILILILKNKLKTS